MASYIEGMRRDEVIARLKRTENLDYGTRKGLHPLLRPDIEREAVRIF